MRAFAKIGLATAAFAIVHSTLASRQAKAVAARMLGEQTCAGSYRLFYNTQAIATFSLLLFYGTRLPGPVLYHFRGRPALLLRIGQAAGFLQLLLTAKTIGLERLSGVTNLRAWLSGERMPVGPVAQGPEMNAEGKLTTHGPFRWSRHPLNFSAIPIIWLTPRMTTRRLAFNLVSSIYLVAGSWHETVRLRQAYGPAYQAYERSGVPFFWPRLPRLPGLHGRRTPDTQDQARRAANRNRHAPLT